MTNRLANRVGPIAPAEAISILRDYARACSARAIITAARLPMLQGQEDQVKRGIWQAVQDMTGTQIRQMSDWRQRGGYVDDDSLRLWVTWHVPPTWERAMSDTQIEGLSHQWLMPLVSEAMHIPRYCFAYTRSDWGIEPNESQQGISIALLRED